MNVKKSVNALFADWFKDWPEGYALYQPISNTQLNAGMCGYFDNEGHWLTIVDLTNPSDLQQKGYSSVSGINVNVTQETGQRNWLCRKSPDIQQPYMISSAEAPGLSIDRAVEVGFKSSSGQGAVIVTDGVVKRTQVPSAYILSQWLRDNGKEVIKKNPDATRQGLWIVTQTYSVRRRALAIFQSKQDEATLSVNSPAMTAGQLEVTAGWWQGSTDSAWIQQHDENGLVLAMSGIHWKTRWYSSALKFTRYSTKQRSIGDITNVAISPIDIAWPEDKSTEKSNAVLVPEVRGDVDGVLRDSDLGIQQEFKDSSEEEEDEDSTTQAWWPRTKVAQSQNRSVDYTKSRRRELGQRKSATMFAERRTFSRKLAESRQAIQRNSLAAAWHNWPVERDWAIESMSPPPVSNISSNDLQPSIEYGQKLVENWSALARNLNGDISVTALAYNSRRNVVSVVNVNQTHTKSLQDFIEYIRMNDVLSAGSMGEIFKMYEQSDLFIGGSEAETGSGLFSLIKPWNGLFEDLIRFLQMTLQAIDLAMLSHLNAHVSTATCESSPYVIHVPTQPSDTMSAEEVLLFRPYRLACLDGLARGRKVWVFHRQSERPREPLYISTSAYDFASIWGPVWPVLTIEEERLIDHYNVGGGHLYPVRNHDGPQPIENERRCHWRKQGALYDQAEDASSTSGTESEPDTSIPRNLQQIREAEPLKSGDNLLIGATQSPKMIWRNCHCSMPEFKSWMRGAQRLHPLRSRNWFSYVSSTAVGLNLGTSGVALAGTATRQTDEGQTFKQGFLEEWENSPRSWNPRDLMDFRGVLVSACSFNARRVRLVDLLKTDTMSALIDRCRFNHKDTRDELIAALDDDDPFAIVHLWERNPDLQDDLGNVFLVCIRALCKSGYDARHEVFNVLWKPPHERKLYRLELQPKVHPWIDLLKDSEDSMTMAVLVEDRLATHRKDRCERTKKPSILETAIVINRSLSPAEYLEKVRGTDYPDPPPWRNADRRWRYIWVVRHIPAGISLRLAEANRLQTVEALTDTHLLLQHTTAFIRLIKDALKIESARQDSHWEYASDNSDDDSADGDIRPVPVHIR